VRGYRRGQFDADLFVDACTSPLRLYNVVHTNMNDIVTCIPIARPRLGKHIPARVNPRKNRTTIVKQRISKQASLTI
jgi:hypothetical protein